MKEIEPLLLQRKGAPVKKMVVGFDGFLDTLVRPVQKKATEYVREEYFHTIEEFGRFLTDKAGKSCSIELKAESKSPGGNMPSLAAGAIALGLDVTCIGMLGEDGKILEEFKNLSGRCYSFAPPGISTCMEFEDGKIFFAPQTPRYQHPWELVLKVTGGGAVKWMQEADILALVNFSELPFSYELWEKTYENIFCMAPCEKDKIVFFDLCDISGKGKPEVEAVVELIGRYSEKRKTILSMNENEAIVMGECLDQETDDIRKTAQLLRIRYGVDEILIHTLKTSILVTKNGMFEQDSLFVECPVRSTGAGDHFNAASCAAAVMGLREEQRIAFANRYVNMYLKTGKTPEYNYES